MTFLVQVSGNDLYIPARECGRGSMHYDSVEVGHVTVAANPRRSLLPYVRRLIGELARMDTDAYVNQYSERINVLYERKGDIFDLDITDLATQPEFDIVVQGNQVDLKDPISSGGDYFSSERQKRFKHRRGAILLGDERLTRRRLVRDVFPQANELQACYLVSPNVAVPEYMDDFSALRKWESYRESELRAEIDRRLPGAGYFVDKGTFEPRILLALINAGPLDADGVMAYLQDGNYGWNDCPCFFDEMDTETLEDDVNHGLQYLYDQGLIERKFGEFAVVSTTPPKPHVSNQIKLGL